MSKAAPVLSRPLPEKFRDAIGRAESEGVERADMVLRLTRRDEVSLKRDRTIPMADISFAGGEMRFLGVKIVAGDISESRLDRTAPEA